MSDDMPPPTPYDRPLPPQQNPYQPSPSYPSHPGNTGSGIPWRGKPPSATLATTALVLAILPLGITWIAAIVLACIALSRISQREALGKGRAIAALVISGLWFLLVLGAIGNSMKDGIAQDEARDQGSGEISVTRSRTGDCLATMPGASAVSTVDIVPCDEAHVGEVFATFDLDVVDDATQDVIDRLAEGGCIKRFAAYVGVPYARSKIDVVYLRPVKGTVDVDDGVACILSDGARETTGSLKNARR